MKKSLLIESLRILAPRLGVTVDTNTNSKRNSADVIKTGTFTKYQLADQMRNYMHIDDKYLEGLETYRMVHMKGGHFGELIIDGQITHWITADLMNTYNVIYHNCTPYNAKRAVEIRCSFRAADSKYNIEPIVLVEIVIPY